MKLRLRLSLPSEERSVPLVRKVMRHALDVMGVAPGCVDDIELALSEACTNVLDHAGAHDHYEVVAGVDGAFCVVEIFDAGGGFVPPAPADQGVLIDPNAEQGRGLQLMRALVDKLDFRVCTERGAVVRLQKSLVYAR